MNICRLDTKGYWKVGSSAIYVPSINTKVEHSNVAGASSGRSEDGIMHIDWVRRDVRKVYLKYPAMTKTELAYMINLMQGKEFTFTFRDQGTTQSMSAYVGESSYELFSYSSVFNDEVYVNVEIHVIEK